MHANVNVPFKLLAGKLILAALTVPYSLQHNVTASESVSHIIICIPSLSCFFLKLGVP